MLRIFTSGVYTHAEYIRKILLLKMYTILKKGENMYLDYIVL